MSKKSEYVEKPKLPEITFTTEAGIEARLTGHFAKYSSGSILMSATECVFKTGDTTGTARVDIGGTAIEVAIGTGDDRRSWVVGIKDINEAIEIIRRLSAKGSK